ncbi:hypothetical protein MKX01_032511, partial [Papaver californicum]
TLILGNRDDIEEMSNSSSTELTTVLKLIDKYDLYGQVAYPKHHKQSDVPEIYRLAAKTKGVFINPALVEPFGLTLIEAAAYGLPVVATKNGGPVDIHNELNNGLLVDPHDQKAISDALLKLVANKSLCSDCRKNGLKNIHRFSWPEHCRHYLSHVEHCRNRHPTTRLEIVPSAEEPMSDSLRDVEDLSLRFSIDGDLKINNCELVDAATRQKEIIDALIKRRHGTDQQIPGVSYSPGRRQRLCVIAVDCYNEDGTASENFSKIIKMVTTVSGTGLAGMVISTGSTLAKTIEALKTCQVEPSDFDALICSSGSEMYYPWRDLPGDNVRSTIIRLAREDGASEDDVTEYDAASNSRSHAYLVKSGAKTRKVDDLRHKVRMRGFRCSPVYTNAGNRLNIVPLFASRAQALRYLSVRWAIELSKMIVFVGEKGDTDHEDLLDGLHKTIILEGSVECGSEMFVRGESSYKREDVVPPESPNIFCVKQGFGEQDISLVLDTLLVTK